MKRWFPPISALVIAAIPSAHAEEPAFERIVRPFLDAHCLECHGPERQKARVRYDGIGGFRAQDRHLWTLVHEKLSTGEMPPRGRPRPPDEATRAVLDWIESAQRADAPSGVRRLNRRELSGALQDLTGLTVDFAAALPGDGRVDGFDTVAEGLHDSADSVTRLLEVTRRATAGLRFTEPERDSRATLIAALSDERDAKKAFEPWKEAGAVVKVRGHQVQGLGLLLEPKWLGERGGFTFHVPPPPQGRGILRLSLTVSTYHGDFEGIPAPHLWVEVAGDVIDRHEITAAADDPAELVYEVQLDDLAIETRGVGITLTPRVEAPYAVDGFDNDERKPPGEVPGGTGLFRPKFDRKELREPREQPIPFVALHRIEVDADHQAHWPPSSWPEASRVPAEPADGLERARALLTLWVDRAWRRPVEPHGVAPFLELHERLRSQGRSFDEALRAAFRAVLMSAPFRYLEAPTGVREPTDQLTAASRLSFLLTASPPDAELRRLATEGHLGDAETLDAQVDRLLDAQAIRRLWEPFVTQWLELEQPITIAMDHLERQDFRFGRHLKDSMRRETIAYVARLFEENRPARELIRSDWTLMNDVLARHYGYPAIEGARLRPVRLRPDDPRGGGILGHAGIQSMLCWMGENWVIYRGAWMLRTILDDPPPPAPLEVPELVPSDDANRGKTFRELLRQHQEDERCSVCHEDMDPLGFAFQNFDLSGRWREVEFERYARRELDGKIEWRGEGPARPIDASGRLPRGEEFTSFAEAKDLLVRHYERDVVRGLLDALATYATGRKPAVDDRAEIDALLDAHAVDGYRLRDLLKGLLRSRAFLGRHPADETPR